MMWEGLLVNCREGLSYLYPHILSNHGMEGEMEECGEGSI